jgi:ABC-type nitrate/sulfonate/bicarbonate transport system ATPase subunit
MTTPRIELSRISKTFMGAGRAVPALEDVSLQVMPGEFVTIIGPSGSGKSTLFNLCVGLLQPDAGDILIDGARPKSRRGMLGYMPQRDLLMPWRSVLDNTIIPLELQGVPKRDARLKALELVAPFGLEGFEKEYPSALSGGMRQRAALLRTCLTGRSTLLLDEPFGALDALTRREMQNWLLEIWHEFGWTVMFITHDVEEAIYLADRVFVLSARPGRVKHELSIELPRPRHQEMIAEPASLMAAEVTVDEAANIIHAHPSFSEAFMEACADALGRSIHLPRKN